MKSYNFITPNRYIDWAARYSQVLGSVDIGLTYFYGASRDPVFIPQYDLMHQGGLDLQYTAEGWLWKLEAIYRNSMDNEIYATTGGFEYTFSNIGSSGLDIGMIGEYLYNFGDKEFFLFMPFDNHAFVGSRLAFNDVQSTELLAGGIVNMENGSMFVNVELARYF